MHRLCVPVCIRAYIKSYRPGYLLMIIAILNDAPVSLLIELYAMKFCTLEHPTRYNKCVYIIKLNRNSLLDVFWDVQI